uniref:Hemerythrin-like metal-binding protein n=1 Tax=Cyanothece sp. (strain PCC 7425 / ATCC 29141) TaxID=395961 RepID=B8HLA9_CYAP4
MNLLVWTTDYESGYASIDQQHQNLLQLLNHLSQAISDRAETDTLQLILNELELETLNHFRDEEKLMGANNYPGYLCHRAAHDNVEREVAKFVAAFATNPDNLNQESLATFSQLILDHICQEDLPMLQSLNSPDPAENELTAANLF